MEKKILYVSSEVFPYAATGGLGDVSGSLGKALKVQTLNKTDVRVVMPLYTSIAEEYKSRMKFVKYFYVNLSWRRQYCGIFCLEKDGVIYYFLDNEYYFKRQNIYGEYDDGERFAFFSKAVLEMLWQIDFYPDILHANDWQSALCVVYLKTHFYNVENYKDIKSVFTIHNIEYQGKFDMKILHDVFELYDDKKNTVEYDGCINLIKAAIVCCDRLTTVSNRYADEIKSEEYSHGLHYILRDYAYKLSGIMNGIDYDYYNPEKDSEIFCNFDKNDLYGKTLCKNALLNELGFSSQNDAPLMTIISRLVEHKGMDLVIRIMEDVVQNQNVKLVVLGTGDKMYEDYFLYLQDKYHEKVRFLNVFDKSLSKRIYSAADIFLMPSKSEPCGLSQMIASRYGAVPVTRKTGGLYDSIKEFYEKDGEIFGNGFTFTNYYEYELKDAVMSAINLYCDKDKWIRLVKKIMQIDFSWKKSAENYMKLYCEM